MLRSLLPLTSISCFLRLEKKQRQLARKMMGRRSKVFRTAGDHGYHEGMVRIISGLLEENLFQGALYELSESYPLVIACSRHGRFLFELGTICPVDGANACACTAKQGEVVLMTSLGDPSYKLELSSLVPYNGLPRATFHFPIGQVSVEEIRNEDEKSLSLSGIAKSDFLDGILTAQYYENDLNLRYCYKDNELTLIPSVSLPSNAVSLDFKRRFSPSDKLSYRYNFDTDYWNAVYKHTFGKNFKVKAGYDSEVRVGWASLWVGQEDGKAKTAPMKTKLQLMLQAPQDNFRNPTFLFRVKKRWDL